jgi:hypothetical protein
MSALRSLLRGFSPLITSLPRLVGRHVRTHTAALVRELIAASRRCFSDATSGDPNQPAAAAKRHLYLVLDDQKRDYGIYNQGWTRANSVRLEPSQQKARAKSSEPEPARKGSRVNKTNSARANSQLGLKRAASGATACIMYCVC